MATGQDCGHAGNPPPQEKEAPDQPQCSHCKFLRERLQMEQYLYGEYSSDGVAYVKVPEGGFALSKKGEVLGPSESWIDREGYPHREGNEPAVIYANGDKEWWTHGQLTAATMGSEEADPSAEGNDA